MKYLKVKDYDSLVRDTTSGAIVVSSDKEYNEHIKRKQLLIKNQKIIAEQANQINELKSEMKEIKELLRTLVKVQTDANNL